ncbi:MAG: monovalent cation/H(+) antiporter subunit G [Desulfofustis sp. PB-SRB1]|jgi:multicomponent Na+:H+ antiporter subunit G|nr:monovalent cation/H(+) antiporter subunit G [Desulfofustis sp. PB-SRB1]MBM1002945.1 monovalent cation/H(+) antiporter subunit G [Desulfofustis sp. PB-SRB1]HBH27318.1 Na+/H+ antiporter subunit G [Desulfofustis sp.]HBH30959.1 Na+/H+ antiporter subunit G [Desulfofustis sp.]
MQTALDIASGTMLCFGIFFFLSGIIALWRFPDTLSRLHAITKADNLGLGLIVLAVALQTGWSIILLKLAAIYLLALYGAAINGYLIARYAHRHRDVQEEQG